MADAAKSIKQARLDYQNLGFVLAEQVFHPAIRAVATPMNAKSSGRIFTLSCAGPVATSERLRNDIGPELTLLAKNLQTTTMMLTCRAQPCPSASFKGTATAPRHRCAGWAACARACP